ncbi:hypothetical protein [Pseudomonas sp. NPDC007930]|uniref:hypothetical protein n=1 Tax=Pseudomonas sp. NPDC007930 TaxID=3364417 RepID=UPI0036E5BDB6
MATLIKGELSNLLQHPPFGALYQPGTWASSYRDQGWVYSEVAWCLPLALAGEPEPTAHLAVQISFMGNNPAGGWSDEPILYVNLWDEPTEVKRGEYMGFPMYSLCPQTLARLKAGDARLFRWKAANGKADRWTFALRLAEINSPDDVRRMICAPISQLLADVDAGEAALGALEGVVTYSAVAEMPDYYRAG